MHTGAPIRILGINAIGQETGNDLIVNGRAIPWLQDVDGQKVWDAWGVSYRDVFVLDAQNRVAAVYNLTEHNLQIAANYDSLESLLLRVAE